MIWQRYDEIKNSIWQAIYEKGLLKIFLEMDFLWEAFQERTRISLEDFIEIISN